MAEFGLKILAVSHQEAFRKKLNQQLSATDSVSSFRILPTLADTVTAFEHDRPDLLIIDLTDCETDACLFIETINYNVENKSIVFGLHKTLDPSIIIRAVSSGVKEFVHYPDNAETLTLAIEKHSQFLSKLASTKTPVPVEPKEKAKLFGVFSPKGGSGSTTVALNLAYEMSDILGKNQVLFLDLDQSYCNLTSLVNAKIEYALNDLEYEKPEDFDEDILERVIVKHPSGVDVLLGCKSVLDDNPPISEQLLVQTIEYLRAKYKAIVVDLPSHNVDIYHQLIASESDDLLVVSSMDIPSLYRGRQYLELAKQNMPVDQIKLIINRHDLKGCVGVSSSEFEDQYSHPVYQRLPNQWSITIEAISVGRFLSQIDEDNALASNIRQLAKNLLNLSDTAPNDEEERLTLLHKLPRDFLGSLKKRNNKIGV